MGDVIEFPQAPLVEMNEYIFTNDPTNPFPQQILHLMHDIVFKNLMGIMQAKHRTTGEIHSILVGLELADDGSVNTYPLCRILTQSEQAEYLAPDGKGGYPEPEENVQGN